MVVSCLSPEAFACEDGCVEGDVVLAVSVRLMCSFKLLAKSGEAVLSSALASATPPRLSRVS